MILVGKRIHLPRAGAGHRQTDAGPLRSSSTLDGCPAHPLRAAHQHERTGEAETADDGECDEKQARANAQSSSPGSVRNR